MKSYKWNASEYPAIEEDSAACLNAALEDGDTSVIAAPIGDIARIARDSALKGRRALLTIGLQGSFANEGSFF